MGRVEVGQERHSVNPTAFYHIFTSMPQRTAHYVISTHWDREWYEPLQGYRMRLVSLLDEVFEQFERDPEFKIVTMDGQYIPVADYLEIRPDKSETIRRYVKEGRFKVGPWYVLPDEWLVSGESIVRNIQLGMRLSSELGAPSSRAGFACDLFGHVSQLPQIFTQLGLNAGGEGLAVDAQGNVYIAAGQIFVYNPAGKMIETIDVPERPLQLVFGGSDRKTLFIAGRTSLYSVKTRLGGQ